MINNSWFTDGPWWLNGIKNGSNDQGCNNQLFTSYEPAIKQAMIDGSSGQLTSY